MIAAWVQLALAATYFTFVSGSMKVNTAKTIGIVAIIFSVKLATSQCSTSCHWATLGIGVTSVPLRPVSIDPGSLSMKAQLQLSALP